MLFVGLQIEEDWVRVAMLLDNERLEGELREDDVYCKPAQLWKEIAPQSTFAFLKW